MGTYEQTMLKLEKMAQANTATQMNWQEKMSKTSHQMEVEDLVKAGLNPVLSSNQGANAYTTSVDSAVNGIAGMASAREGANATRYAARQSAMATRAMAAAQMEAARLSAEASRYASDRSYEAAKYQTDFSKNGTIYGVGSNLLKDLLKTSTPLGGMIKGALGTVKNKAVEDMFMNKNVSNNYSSLNGTGKNFLNNMLNKLGISRSRTNQNIMMQALFFGNQSAMNKVKAWALTASRRYNSSRSGGILG